MNDGTTSGPKGHQRLSDRNQQRLVRTSVVLGAALAVTGSATVIAMGYGASWWSGFAAFIALLAILFAVFVWMVLPRQARNPVVWITAVSSFLAGLFVVGLAGAVLLTSDDSNLVELLVGPESVVPADLPAAAAWIMTIVDPLVTVALFSWLTFGLLLFPDGRLPSPRWRWVVGMAVGGNLVAGAAIGWSFRPGNTGLAETGPAVDVGLSVLTLAVILSLAALVGRFRRSRGATRQQFKWIVWGASIFLPAQATAMFLGGTRYNDLSVAALMVGTAIFALSYGVAIGKYRLFDIDVVINKTIMVAALAMVITMIYVGIVVGVGLVLGSENDAEFAVQVVATVAVAVAFGPARRRAQQWANRTVYGERATPYEVLARFSHRAAEASDDELLARIPRLIVDGTGAVGATLWVRSNMGFRVAAIFPEAASRPEIRRIDSFEDPDADYSLPVFHDGELLGGLSLFNERSEAIPPAEERLVANLASGIGMALRNAALTSQLRNQVAELEASRDRILAADDEARRSLERDLDSGPQQQLVAMKVMLGPTRKQAERAGAIKTAEVLAQLESDAGEAIRAVRDFSGGVYPPLLEAEGLAVTLSQQTKKTALPVQVEAEGIGRYPREVEVAVYFAILEGLQNIAKYAGASRVSVALREVDGELSFEVSDDGRGFDASTVVAGSGLANMADRLDAIAGILSFDSTPGSGTTVRGTVPIGDRVSV